MKKIMSLLLCSLMLIGSSSTIFGEESIYEETENLQQRFYISASASPDGDGSQNHPFSSIKEAQEAVKKLTAQPMTGNIEVVVLEGVYQLEEPLQFGKEDSGNSGYEVVYRGEGYPLISGGQKIEGFEPVGNGMWKAKAEGFERMRELYVNDTRVNRASTEREVTGLGDYDDPNTGYQYDGIYFDKRVLPDLENPDEVDFRWGVGWKGNSAMLEKIIPDPNDSSRVIAIMQQPQYNGVASVPKWGHAARWDFGFRIENAFEFLDMPGEYYFNSDTKELFYIPREGEDMTTAEVYAPVLEKIMIVDGGDGELVENIRFEGLRFAHAAFNLPAEVGGYSHGQQGDNFVGRSYKENTTQGAIDILNAKNITMQGCVLFGMGAAALRLHYNVSDCNIVGNAVYDTGESGISIGMPDHSSVEEEKPAGWRQNMVLRSTFTPSDIGNFGQYARMIYDGTGDGWVPLNDVYVGRKSFFKLEFDIPVSVDEIVITTSADTGEVPQKRNFEILLSNDPDFNTYTVVHRQGATSYEGESLSLKPGTNEKFKYCMIRKTEVEDFRITELAIYTKDIEWFKRDVCRNIMVADNYVTRTGNYYYGSAGIGMYYGDSISFMHNEIYYVPYSGMSIGWGWSNLPSTLANTKIVGNLVDTYNMELHDGGGIYTLGRQANSEYYGNYIKNENGPFAAMYFDDGSSDFTVHDNVVENSANVYFIWNQSQQDIHVTNTYANSPTVTLLGTNCSGDPVKTFISGDPQPEAKAIMDNAGLRPEYQAIKEQVPDAQAYYGRERMDNYSSFYYHFDGTTYTEWTKKMATIAETCLETDRYGDLPGQYSPDAALMLADRLSEMTVQERTTDARGIGQAERYYRLEVAMREFENSFQRLSLSDTIAAAQKLLEETPIGTELGTCTQEAKNTFEAAIASASDSSVEEYTRLRTLEQAISEFDHSILKADILAFRLDGIDAPAVINEGNHTIEIMVDESVDLTNLTANAIISDGAELFPDFSQPIDFTYPVQAVVKNHCKSQVWTIRVSRYQSDSTEPDTWWNWFGDEAVKDGTELLFAKSDKPYLWQGGQTNSINLTMRADRVDTIYGTRVVFDSVNGELMLEGLDAVNSYFEFVIAKDVMYLYRIEGGVKQILFGSPYDKEKVFDDIINTADFISNLKEPIQVGINYVPEGGKKRVAIQVNGKTAINALCDTNNTQGQGYYGVYTPDTQLHVMVK